MIYSNILDTTRTNFAHQLTHIPDHFYMAGGTALALQLGHRDSIDFDFFTPESFDPQVVLEQLQLVWNSHEIQATQIEHNTLTVIVDQTIKISFFSCNYPLLRPLVQEFEHSPLASVEDIACMKLSAVVGRATKKDYIDIYTLLEKFTLNDLLDLSEQKYPTLDKQVILTSLVYFEDIDQAEPIMMIEPSELEWSSVVSRIGKAVKEHQSKQAKLNKR